MSTRNISWGQGGRCLGLTILSPSCVDCHEIWETRPPGTLRACIEIALPNSMWSFIDKFLGFSVDAKWCIVILVFFSRVFVPVDKLRLFDCYL
jgi:hypothetical protein